MALSTLTTFVARATRITADWLNAVDKMLVGPVQYNVMGYGAQGDDATNDTTAFAAAITAANGGVVLVPGNRTYIVENLTIATAKTSLMAMGPGAVLKLKAGAATPNILNITAADVAIEGIAFNPNDVTNGVGVRVKTGGDRTQIRGCLFVNPKSGGVHIEGSPDSVRIQNNTFSGPGYGILTNPASTLSRLLIANNTFVGGSGSATRDAICINAPDGGATDVTVSGNVISGYTEVYSNRGFGIAFANVTRGSITGNTVRSCGRNGIHIEDLSSQISVTGNTVSDCGQAGIEVQAVISIPCNSITIVGNTVTGCCANPAYGLGNGGIEIGSSATQNKSIIVSGNMCVANAAAGIYAYENRSVVISNNICRNNTGPGLYLTTVINGRIIGNLCTDDQGTKTQTYGLKTFGSGQDALIAGNNFLGNLTGAVDNGFSTAPTWRDNQGYVTRNYGATSVADGGTISHGLATTPTVVTVTCSTADEYASVSAKGSSTFTVQLTKHDGTAGTTAVVYWTAEV